MDLIADYFIKLIGVFEGLDASNNYNSYLEVFQKHSLAYIYLTIKDKIKMFTLGPLYIRWIA